LIWKHNSDIEQRILDDLEERFAIRAIFRVEWCAETWAKSLARLYTRPVGQEPRNWKKLSEVGYKPFLFVVVWDPAPRRAVYNDKGVIKYGNVNIFEAKRDYRNWVGTKYAVHSSIDDAETRWNLALVLGLDHERVIEERARDDPLKIVPLRAETWGASGWTSHVDMFGLLGLTTDYAVMRQRGPFPGPRAKPEGPDIDVLVRNVGLAANALNPKIVKIKHDSIICFVELEGGWSKVQLYDYEKFAAGRKWSLDILENAVEAANGVKVAIPSDDFYLFLLNGLSKRKLLRSDYRNAVEKLYQDATPEARPPSEDEAFVVWCQSHFHQFVRTLGYDVSPPSDPPPKAKKAPSDVTISKELLASILASPPLHKFRRSNFDSAIWKHELASVGPIAVKLVKPHDPALASIITREHIFLERLKGNLVPEVIWGGIIADKYCLISRWVDAVPLDQMAGGTLKRIIDRNGLTWFENELTRICDHLEKNGVSHRDLCEKNILLSMDRVYLIDFTWAIFKDEDNPPVKSKFQNRDDRADAAALTDYVKMRIEPAA
ncbi:MAG: protein kinase, partial [Alphaproteobacteria bacterium]|nr:protein kinase [Alphaproteobacteria bacterium]